MKSFRGPGDGTRPTRGGLPRTALLRLIIALGCSFPVESQLCAYDSGSWVWLAVFGFAVWLARTLISAQLGLGARLDFDSWTWLLDWAVILANLASVMLALLPGNKAPNRFGANPRQPA